jgi:predicted ArsR family transcriptional regulator
VAFLNVLRDFARPHWLEIILLLKRSQGMPVASLAKATNMSYMGVKQHCVEMERLGYLDTWRHAGRMGRPRKYYRLTEKANELFPDMGGELSVELLDSVRSHYGSNAPEKLLLHFFAKQRDRYAVKIRGESFEERAASLARLRFAEGYISRCLNDEEQGLRIVEYHSLLHYLEGAYPAIAVMEVRMFGELIGTRVTRTVNEAAGLREYIFRLGE